MFRCRVSRNLGSFNSVYHSSEIRLKPVGISISGKQNAVPCQCNVKTLRSVPATTSRLLGGHGVELRDVSWYGLIGFGFGLLVRFIWLWLLGFRAGA